MGARPLDVPPAPPVAADREGEHDLRCSRHATQGFVINWVAYVPSYLAKTEKYFDLVGSLTYISVTLLAIAGSRDLDLRAVLVAVAVMIWATRLGSFLFARIRRDGHDRRFDAIKVDPLRLLMTWTLQGLWVSLTLASALAAITAEQREAFGILAAVGLVLWAVGFGIEVVADRQKQAFRADPGNQDRFITEGLWAWSRHPNYFGEILLWFGTAVLAVPVLDRWRLVTLVSPVFVYLLLTRISGVPLLEARARKKWGAEAAFQEFMRTTRP